MTTPEPTPIRRGRGRPRSVDAVNPRDILEATVRAVAEGGYAALSVRGVARSLGVSLATVQHHFGTRAQLYQAAVEYTLAEVERERAQISDRSLRQRIRNALAASSSRPGVLAAFVGDRAPGNDERLAHFAARYRDLFDAPEATVADLQGDRTARQIDADAFMVLLTIGITSVAGAPEAVRALYGIDVTRPEDCDRLADGLADIISNGLFDPAPSPAAPRPESGGHD